MSEVLVLDTTFAPEFEQTHDTGFSIEDAENLGSLALTLEDIDVRSFAAGFTPPQGKAVTAAFNSSLDSTVPAFQSYVPTK